MLFDFPFYFLCFFDLFFFFFKQKTAYELRISDWSSDVCSSDLAVVDPIDQLVVAGDQGLAQGRCLGGLVDAAHAAGFDRAVQSLECGLVQRFQRLAGGGAGEDVEELAVHGGCPCRCRRLEYRFAGQTPEPPWVPQGNPRSLESSWARARTGKRCNTPPRAWHNRSEEHTSELQSLMRNSYALF